jgi:hypothetical protein
LGQELTQVVNLDGIRPGHAYDGIPGSALAVEGEMRLVVCLVESACDDPVWASARTRSELDFDDGFGSTMLNERTQVFGSP